MLHPFRPTHPLALAPLQDPGKSLPNAGKPHRIDRTNPCIINHMDIVAILLRMYTPLKQGTDTTYR
jgi:hypothetical protein